MTGRDVEAVAVTAGPGLTGALLVGVAAAKAYAVIYVQAAQEAAASYAVAFERTQDTLGRLVHDLAGWMGSASTWINERFRRGGESA